ncbi:MAG: lycopene beta-cyclase CrtY [Wenzhouxiangellaceae bacterium]|nr:lycopene beta-cyclase CrtY [Wenzhouxiangellaceae bacterium]
MDSSKTLLLAGAGLANALIALRLAERHPGTRIVLLEAGPAAGGEHTWSFHAGDLSADQHRFVADMVVRRWPGQQVRFPTHARRLDSAYLSMTTASLAARLSAEPAIELRCNAPVTAMTADAVTLADGARLTGTAVIDGRGPRAAEGVVLGFQKFVGRVLETDVPHGLELPVIMDATVDQHDGYRFVYVLPFGERELLIEDTCYSDGQALPESVFEQRITDYAQMQGWTPLRTIRREHGVLPILLAGDFERFWPAGETVARAGLHAGLFHPTTGYSLPQAMALADAIASAWPLDGPALARLTRAHACNFWRRTAFFRLLNRMLFRAGRPEHRYRVLERFYRLEETLITRFYAASLTLADQARLLIGKPPVPVRDAMKVLRESTFLQRESKD